MSHKVTEARRFTRRAVRRRQFDVAFLDLHLGQEEGLDVLPVLLKLEPGLSVIMVTAYATIETAVEAMRRRGFRLFAQAVHAEPTPRRP